jgi:hypothetical protein
MLHIQIYSQVQGTEHGRGPGGMRRWLNELAVRNLPMDYHVHIDRLDRMCPEDVAAAVDWQRRGNLVAPCAWAQEVDSSLVSPNWFDYDLPTCARLVAQVREHWLKLGFARMDAFATYCPGTEFMQALKNLDVKFLLGMCAPQVFQDGAWGIQHTGCPITPYFVSDEEYRKLTVPKPGDELLASSMCPRNPINCFEHWPEVVTTVANMIQGPERTLATGEHVHECYAMFEDWIRMAGLSGTPMLHTFDMEVFPTPKCFDANLRLLDWLCVQRDKGRVKFINLPDWAAMMKAAGGFIPQTIYWRGEQMGNMVCNKPGTGIETVMHESLQGQWSFRKGFSGARRYYDYSEDWTGCKPYTPRAEEPPCHEQEVAVSALASQVSGESVVVTFRASARADKPVKFAVWGALENLASPFELIEASAPSVVIAAHPGGTGAVLLVEDNLTPEGGEYRLVIGHGGQKENRHSRNWRGLIGAESVVLDGRPFCRLAIDVPYRLRFCVKANPRFRVGKVRYEYISGPEFSSGEMPFNGLDVVLDGTATTSVLHLWDVEAGDVEISEADLDAAEFAIAHRHRTLAKTYDLGDTATFPRLTYQAQSKDWPEWIKLAARRGADEDIAQMNQLVREIAPGSLLAAKHCAADLPFGTIMSSQCQPFDRFERFAPGDEKIEIRYCDFGQSFGPGHTGWNMFAWIRVGLLDLDPEASYGVALNLYDAEGRGTVCQGLTAGTDRSARKELTPLMQLFSRVPLAQGFDARRKPAALVVADLPQEASAKGAAIISIESNSTWTKYDRITERLGVPLLGHVYLLKLPKHS